MHLKLVFWNLYAKLIVLKCPCPCQIFSAVQLSHFIRQKFSLEVCGCSAVRGCYCIRGEGKLSGRKPQLVNTQSEAACPRSNTERVLARSCIFFLHSGVVCCSSSPALRGWRRSVGASGWKMVNKTWPCIGLYPIG